jgi:hypothetical protein
MNAFVDEKTTITPNIEQHEQTKTNYNTKF